MVKVAVFPGHIVCAKLVLVILGNGFTVTVTEAEIGAQAPTVEVTV